MVEYTVTLIHMELLQVDLVLIILILQQVPARDPELGPLIRSLFIPEEEAEWVCADYSQQEPRVLVHYASLKNMQTAINSTRTI
jgi:DNA polymerase I-like protein with 3'-5' exonuclease and polymerase domains